MENERNRKDLDLLKYVDHTLLKAYATWEDVQELCKEALEFNTASVCVPPSYVKRIHDEYGDRLNICTVIGFPLGYQTKKVKIEEGKEALKDGAKEIDMVINITDIKNGNYEKVEEEIKALKDATGNKILKVIIETCYLTEEEKIMMCKLVSQAGADYIKTSTGFGTGGATLANVRLFKENIGPNVKIKAAGGIRSLKDLEDFINEGCHRIGTSSAIALYRGERRKDY